MRTLAKFVTKAYTYIIFFWVLIAIIMGIFAIRLPSMLEGDGFKTNGEHAEVMDIASDTFGMPAETMFLVFENKDDDKINSTIKAVEKLNVASEIVSPLEDASMHKKNIAYALLHFDNDHGDMSDIVTDIRDAIGDEKGITLTGRSAITKDINSASQKDLVKAEAIGLPIAIIVLLLAFGTVVASFIPLIIGLVAVITSFGILTLIGGHYDLSVFVLNIIPMLGLALSIDFALLFISRYREERKKGNAEAVSITIQTAGRSVLFSAFCVFIGLGAMMLIDVDIFKNIGLGGMIVVSMAVLASVTLLPSILLLLGDRIDKWQVIRVKKNGSDNWRKFANGVIKRPVTITIIALVALGITIIPVKNMDLAIPQIDSLPKSYDTRSAFEKMEKEFDLGGKSSVFVLAKRANGWDNEEGFEQIKALEEDFKNDPLVDDVTTIFSLSGIETVDEWEYAWNSPMKETELMPLWENLIKEDTLLLPVSLKASGGSDAAQDWVRELPSNKDDTSLMIGGAAKFNQEIFDEIADKIVLVLTVILATTFIVLMIAFRSILIPIKAILMNVVGLSATFGILVYIFQYGHFGLTASSIALIIPVIVFSLVFGLSMDYEVFLISRMQEEYANTQDNDYATVEGLAVTSKIITSAALIMIVITGAFAFTDVMPVKQIGVGIAIAVAIDATIIRLLLVPSLMKLFGKWNWWLPFRKGEYRAGRWH